MAAAPPDLRVDLDGQPNTLAVRFPFDARLVSLVKAVPGRRYHPDNKYWTIPTNGLRMLQQEAARRNIGISLSEKIAKAQEHGQDDKAELRALKVADDAELTLNTKTIVRPYQRAGIEFLRQALRKFKGALLADDMGLGKTLQALSLISLSRMKSVLVLCPASVKYVWEEEIKKHYPSMPYIIIEGDAEQRRQQWSGAARIKIANYELLLHDKSPSIMDWDLVICDEITRAKNYQTKTAKKVKSLDRRYNLGLSGAPIENRLEELHSIMDFVMPGLLGPGWLFVQRYCVKNRYNAIVGYRNIGQIRQKIAPHYLRRIKDDVLTELPPKTINDVWLELSDDEWDIYEVIRLQIKEMIKENPTLRVANVLTEMIRLKQCTDDCRLLGEEGIESSKVQALTDILEAAEGHQVVAFTQFAQFAKLLAAEIDDVLLIDGSVSPKRRASIIQQFQSGNNQLLIGTDALAYGVTLTAADIVVNLDQPWTPARLRQREDRLHRIGQEKNVQVVNLIARRTIDEYVRKIIHRKRELVKSVFHEESDVEEQHLTKSDLLALLGEKE